MNRDLLVRAVEVVVFVFAAFGGFLEAIAPPEDVGARLAVGLGCFGALIVLLSISHLGPARPGRRHRRRWGIAALVCLGAGLAAGAVYARTLSLYTYGYPPEARAERHVAGTELTAVARSYRERNPTRTTAELVADFGGPAFEDRIWIPSSRRRAGMYLMLNYLGVVLALSTAVFALAETARRKG